MLGMVEPARDLRFVLEAFDDRLRVSRGMTDFLQRHVAIQIDVAREPNAPQPTLAELANQFVAAFHDPGVVVATPRGHGHAQQLRHASRAVESLERRQQHALARRRHLRSAGDALPRAIDPPTAACLIS